MKHDNLKIKKISQDGNTDNNTFYRKNWKIKLKKCYSM